jgi:hypothetical protein
MKIPLGAAVVLPTPVGVLHAEPTPMRNILGFDPGMSYTQAMSVAADVCRGDKDMISPEVFATEVRLQRTRIVTVVGKLVAAGMPQHAARDYKTIAAA